MILQSMVNRSQNSKDFNMNSMGALLSHAFDSNNNDMAPQTDLDRFCSGIRHTQAAETIPEECSEEGGDDLEMGGAQECIVDDDFEVNSTKQ